MSAGWSASGPALSVPVGESGESAKARGVAEPRMARLQAAIRKTLLTAVCMLISPRKNPNACYSRRPVDVLTIYSGARCARGVAFPGNFECDQGVACSANRRMKLTGWWNTRLRKRWQVLRAPVKVLRKDSSLPGGEVQASPGRVHPKGSIEHLSCRHMS
jgi:hypothetical protein